jgi:putative nucleotidyltransferase with HDIG domain
MPFTDESANEDHSRRPLEGLRVVEPPAEAPAGASETEAERVPLRLAVYIALVVAAGAGAIVAGIPTLSAHDLGGLIALGVLIVLAQNFEVVVYGDSRLSVSVVPLFAIALLYGPGAAAITYPAASAVGDALNPSKHPWFRNVFNYAVLALVGFTLGVVDRSFAHGPDITPELAVASLFGAGAAFAVSTALIAVAVALYSNRSVPSVYAEEFLWSLPHYLVLGFLGVALGVAYVKMGFFGLFAFLSPPVMMHLAIRQYVARTTRSVSELRHKNEQLQSANESILRMTQRLQETYEGTLEALVSALDARDRETKGHSLRVMQYTMDIARVLGIPEGSPEWNDIQRGALLHDVGKIGVADSILHKPGPLTPEEWVEMKKHPHIGFEMLQDIPFLAGAARIIMAHHERFDGKGYPRGLAGDEIPLGARIFVIADTFDAMTSDRPYRRALPPEVARDEIVKNSGSQFDPVVVQAFLKVYPIWVRSKRAPEVDHGQLPDERSVA